MIVWLSSYPRSGNTFFRVILNTVFNIKTYSIYDDTGDIGADEATSDIVGHTFLPKDFDIEKARDAKEMYYIKTHELLENMTLDAKDKVIYLVRDGRASTSSFTKHLQNFYGKTDDNLDDVIYGNTPYGSWGDHVRQWKDVPQLRVKFEELTDTPETIIKQIANYLGVKPVGGRVPTFEELHAINPKFFRSGKKDGWKAHFKHDEHLAFWLRNYQEMKDMEYTNDIPNEVNETSFPIYASLFHKEFEALKINRYTDTLLKQKLKATEEKNKILQKQLNQILTSKSYTLGETITKPYRWLKKKVK